MIRTLKVKIISDMHLRSFDTTGNDDMKRTDEELMKYLDKDSYDVLVMVGDMYDTLKRDTFEPLMKEYQDICNKYPKFTEKIESRNKIIYIKGNHDRIMEKQELYNLRFNNYTIHFEHGNKCDFICHEGRCLSECGVCIHGNIERQNKEAADWIEMNGDDLERDKKRVRDYAETIKGYNLVIMGHSHVYEHCKLENGSYYINTGTSKREEMDEVVLYIDTRGDEVKKVRLVHNIVNIHTLKRQVETDKEIFSSK